MTNADKIRSMTDDELAEFMAGKNGVTCPVDRYVCYPWDHCLDCWKEWLIKEVDE